MCAAGERSSLRAGKPVAVAEDLAPAGQKLLEEKMIGIKVVLCTSRTIDQLEDSGFRTALIFRFGVRTLQVAG